MGWNWKKGVQRSMARDFHVPHVSLSCSTKNFFGAVYILYNLSYGRKFLNSRFCTIVSLAQARWIHWTAPGSQWQPGYIYSVIHNWRASSVDASSCTAASICYVFDLHMGRSMVLFMVLKTAWHAIAWTMVLRALSNFDDFQH